MIDQQIKEKLNLHNTGIQHGCSFIYNCEILLWPAKSNDQVKVYIMDCDMLGMPLEDGKLRALIQEFANQKKEWTWCEFSDDAVLSAPEFVMDSIDREVKNINERVKVKQR